MTYLNRAAKEILSTYPKFADGRIDYTAALICYVLNCTAVCGDRVLLTRRSDKVITYPGMVNGISGFVDQPDVAIEDLAKIELDEEVGAPSAARIKVGEIITQIDDTINREWRVYPVLAEFKTEFAPRLNWENRAAFWCDIGEVQELQLLPGFAETFAAALAMRALGLPTGISRITSHS
jgi:hypothetical protein